MGIAITLAFLAVFGMLNYLQIVEAKDREALTTIIQNPFIQMLKARLGQLQHDRVKLLDRYGDRHPQVQNIAKQIARKPDEATVNTKPEVGQGVQL